MTDNNALTKENVPKTEIPPEILTVIATAALTQYNADNEIETQYSVIEVTREKAPPPKPQEYTLGVSNLFKSFGKKLVVKGVNFTMKNGEVAGLLGPNGAGKTTIFYMIVGFYQPTMGYVTMDDIDITQMPMYRRARMGIAYLPQEASIFRKLTVEQNIWAILESRQDIDDDAKKEKLESLLDEFGIGRIRTQLGYTLSGGERRRTEIARALATEPKFLLLDEPFAGIDPNRSLRNKTNYPPTCEKRHWNSYYRPQCS